MIAQIRHWFDRTFADPQVVILALLLVVGVVAVMMLGRMLMPVLAALVIAYLLEGLVQRLQRYGMPRLVSVVTVFAGFITFLLFLIFALLPMITRQLAAIVRALPDYIARAQAWLAQLPERYPQLISPAKPVVGPPPPGSVESGIAVTEPGAGQILEEAEVAAQNLALVSEEQLSRMLDNLGTELINYGATLVSLSGVMGVVNLLIFLVLMPVLVFFFLKDKRLLTDWIARHLPRNRGLAVSVWQEVDKQIGNYVRGKVLEILIVWLVTYAIFLMLGLNFAMLLSLIVGLSVIIPFVGAAVVTLPVALVAIIQFGPSAMFVYVLIAYAVIQALDGNVLVPILFSEVVSLHPVAIIVAILVFGGIWGFWGVFFAIPLATLVNAVLRAWPRVKAEEDQAEPAAAG